jgi:hypothetical protein
MPAAEAATPETPEAPALEATTESAPQEVAEEPKYQRWDFLRSDPDAPAAAPETTAAPEAEEPKAEAPAPEAPAAEDFDDETWERIKKSPRIERLVENRYGNKLADATARARDEAAQALRKEDAEWQNATALYNRLSEDEDAYKQAVEQHGSPAVLRFMANYEEAAQTRQQQTGPQVAAIEKARAEFAQGYTRQFNEEAVGEVKRGLAATIPFYGELSESTRKAIEDAAYNPDGNWMADVLTALGKGLKERDDRREREHKAALAEAAEAGRNEQRAATEERGPVLVKSGDSGGFQNFRDVENAYNTGQIGYEQFQAYKKQFRRDY